MLLSRLMTRRRVFRRLMHGTNDSRWMPFLYRSLGWRFDVVTSTTPCDMSASSSLVETI